MTNSIRNKLIGGFGLCVMLVLAMVVLNLSNLQRLEALYHGTMKRSAEMELAADVQHIGEDLYLIIANTVINRDIAKSEQLWANALQEDRAKLRRMCETADSPLEHDKIREAQEAFDEIIGIFEQELLPLIKAGAEVPGAIEEADARIDARVVIIDLALQRIAASISEENQQAAREFNAVLKNNIQHGLILSLIGVLIALSISVITSRRIVRSLSELTWAALEIERGNYQIELGHGSKDEAGVLASAFKSMADQVQKRTIELLESNEHLNLEIIEHKLTQEQLRQARDGLELRVRERTVELATANSALVAENNERRRAEEALRQTEEELRYSNARLQEVFDGISDPLIMLDNQLRLRMLNNAAKKYYGLANYDDAFGRACYEGLRRRKTPCTDCGYPDAVIEGSAATFERKSPMDPSRFEQLAVYPVINEQGERDAAILRVSDITQAKLMEKQLIQSEKLASLGLLVSGVAHEINNPNNFVSFNVPILRDYFSALMPILDDYAKEHTDLEFFCMSYKEFRDDLFKLLDNMEHGATRISSIVSALKEYARKRDKTEAKWMDLKAVIDKTVNICHAEIRKKVKSFTVEVPDDLPVVFSDPEAIEQVLVNLLINAIQASDKVNSWIRLKVVCEESPERRCFIEVSDNGCGMDETARDKIFDPFFTTKAPSSGTGLGLYVCYNLVQALDGKIEVESVPGEGSTFRVVLPNIARREP